MKRKPSKPPQCQWMIGVTNGNVSGWKTCKEKPWFRVFQDGILVGWVCEDHCIDANNAGFKTE